MEQKEARRHHHIPQFYLRGFATGSGKKTRVQVASLRAQRWFEAHPKNIGVEKDFLRFDAEGVEPDALEKAMSGMESQVAEAIRNVEATEKFEGEDRVYILNFIALLAVRSPQMRENWRQAQDRLCRMMMDMSLATKERWEGQMQQMRNAGREVKEDVTYEQMKEFHDKGEYDITVNREWHIRMEFEVFQTVLNCLADRSWSLYVTNEKLGPFVTSDRPVIISWKYPEKVPVMMRKSPGYGMKDTEVYFPITKRLALVGEFDGPEETFSALPSVVSIGNVQMIEWAFEQLYTVKRSFRYIGPPLALYHDANFMERFAEEKARRKIN